MSNEVELYKELGAYERHFNTMQGICRNIASTWLLATIGGIGYVVSKNFSDSIIKFWLAGSLVALAGAIGIFLLWILDVLVYHKLLLAVFEGSNTLEQKLSLENQLELKVRSKMRNAFSSGGGGVTWLISLFYGVPMVLLSVIAFVLALSGRPSLNYVCSVLAAIMLFVALWVLITNTECAARSRAVLASWATTLREAFTRN
jgi:hypothetical protein